jgi:DNA polymerase elongation subunit (family B)
MVHDWTISDQDDKFYIYATGKAENGNTVCLRIDGFCPFVYLEFPPNDTPTSTLARNIYSQVCTFCGKKAPTYYKFEKKKKLQTDQYCYFLKLGFRSMDECNSFCKFVAPKHFGKYKLHEDNIDPLIKYIALQNLDCSGFIKATTYVPVENDVFATTDVTCYAMWNKVTAHKPQEATFVRNYVASFDIECQSENYNSKVPKAEVKGNRIFQIAVTFAHNGDEEKDYEPYLLTLYDCPKIGKSKDRTVPVKVLNFKSEGALLAGFTKLINEKDPDIIVGYNTHKFDWPYMISRAKRHGIFQSWHRLGRIDDIDCSEIELKWSSSAYKEQKFKLLNIPGRFLLDLMVHIERNYKFDSFSLNNVAESLLKLHKKDLTPKQLFILCDIAQKTATMKAQSESTVEEIKKIVNEAINDDDVTDDDGNNNILYKVRDKVNTELTTNNIDLIRKLTIGYIGKYCVWDTYLPLMIVQKLNTLEGLRQMSNITGVPMNWIQLRGQQIKVVSQIYKWSLRDNYVMGNKKYEGISIKRYQGATVFPIKPGAYKNVGTNDFASLYPSIIIAFNICWSTFIRSNQIEIKDKDCHVIEWESHVGCDHDPNKEENLKKAKDFSKRKEDENNLQDYILCGTYRYRFRKPYIDSNGVLQGQGLLPRMLADLLMQRKCVKKAMAKADLILKMNKGEATDGDIKYASFLGLTILEKGSLSEAERKKWELTHIVADKLQLALKVCANSAYGSMGAQVGYMPLVEGAASVTAKGRELIGETARYTERNGGVIVGGDTDSVFVTFPGKSVAESFKLCKDMAKMTTHHLKCILIGIDDNAEMTDPQKQFYDILPINLEFENMYGDFITFTKKRYIATIINEEGQIINRQRKGVITARKDNSRIARKICGSIMEMALDDKPKIEVMDAINKYCLGLFTRQVSVKDLIIYKGIQNVEDYKQQNASHVALARRMNERGDEVLANTRMEYLLLWNGIKDQRQGEKAEDYTFYRENRLRLGLQIDYPCYIERQLTNPLKQLLDTKYPGEKLEYTNPELYIFGLIYRLPKTIFDKILLGNIYSEAIRVEELLKICNSKAEEVKDNKRYILVAEKCQKYLETKENKKEILYELFGHVHVLNSAERKIIYKQRLPNNDFHRQVKVIKNKKDEYLLNATNEADKVIIEKLLKCATYWYSRWVIKTLCNRAGIRPPNQHEPAKGSTTIVRDDNFLDQICASHVRHRSVVERLNELTGPFRVED